jgi:hypothetical protein
VRCSRGKVLHIDVTLFVPDMDFNIAETFDFHLREVVGLVVGPKKRGLGLLSEVDPKNGSLKYV